MASQDTDHGAFAAVPKIGLYRRLPAGLCTGLRTSSIRNLRHTLGAVMLPDHSAPERRATTNPCSRRAWLAAAAATLVAPAVAADDEQPVIVNQPVPGAQIELQFTPGFSAVQRERARQWVVSAAEAVSGYFARFPVPQ